MKRVGMAVAMCVVFSGVSVFAQSAPIQLSLTPDIALQSRDTVIEGVCLSVWGENEQRALALGIVNGSKWDSQGFTWSWLLNYAEDYRGVQWAMINYAKDDVTGWQWGAVNYCGGDFFGLQLGLVNYAEYLKGLQFGFLNFARATMEPGVQIGLLNLMPETTEWFSGLPEELAPGMIFVNWRF